jgi:xylulokinase
MNKLVNDVPIGSEGLINFPFGNGAERVFNNKIIGSHFINLNFNKHGKAHLYRSAIEGIAFSFAYGIELMKKDKAFVDVIKAGNDNLFQSKVFVKPLSSIIGQKIQIYNTNGAIGAARASTIEGNNFDYFKKSNTTNDLVLEYEPKKNNEKYILAYEEWKKELKKKIKIL